MEDDSPHNMPGMTRSDSSGASSVDQHIHAPIPIRPGLPSRRSSGTMIVPRDSYEVGPVELELGPNDVRAMSPRRTSQDIEALGKEARAELQRHAKALQDSLISLFNRIEAVKEEHNKLDNNNKFLQKYIGDLMTTSKITASSSRSKK
ncbi:bZIP transcription factor [Rhypophila sp. PSN 637]